MLRARARRLRTPRASCAAVAPRAHHAVTGVRHRLIGVAYARTAALAGCRSVFAPPAPRREAGRLRSVGLFARVDAARAAAIASGPCAHRCGGESLSPPRYCVCPPAALAGCRSVSALPAPRREAGWLRSVGLFARVDAAWAAAIASGPCAPRCGGESPSPPRYCCARLPSSVVGPSGLRARRGMASPGAVSSALRAARALRRVVSASGRRARVFRGAKARRAGLAAGVILITGRVRVFALQPARPSVRRPVPLPGRVTWPALATVCPVVRLPSFCHQASR